jgi:hypothetical protein
MPFQSQKHHYFPENWSLIYNFFNFFIPFYDRSGFKSGSGTESRSGTSTTRHSGSGSAKAKSYGSCRFDSGGSTTLVKGDIRDFLARIQLCVCLPSVCVYNAVWTIRGGGGNKLVWHGLMMITAHGATQHPPGLLLISTMTGTGRYLPLSTYTS